MLFEDEQFHCKLQTAPFCPPFVSAYRSKHYETEPDGDSTRFDGSTRSRGGSNANDDELVVVEAGVGQPLAIARKPGATRHGMVVCDHRVSVYAREKSLSDTNEEKQWHRQVGTPAANKQRESTATTASGRDRQ